MKILEIKIIYYVFLSFLIFMHFLYFVKNNILIKQVIIKIKIKLKIKKTKIMQTLGGGSPQMGGLALVIQAQ